MKVEIDIPDFLIEEFSDILPEDLREREKFFQIVFVIAFLKTQQGMVKDFKRLKEYWHEKYPSKDVTKYLVNLLLKEIKKEEESESGK